MGFSDNQDDKQQRIIFSALNEFAEYGYDRASTNRIVKNAGVGKGMLYYYFNNKWELFLYLVKESLDVIEEEYLNKVDLSETDFFERMSKIAEFKMKVYLEHSQIFNFMSQVFIMEESKLPDELRRRIVKLREESYAKLYSNIDFSSFKDDIDVDKAFQLIQWSIDGYQNNLIHRHEGTDFSNLDFESLKEEFLDYIEVLRKAFYK
ncbi:TetR/AcrR family transcriptional regulator [Filobacillus milosensis]|nr:TetR/AcrR family transcriptional regulator [Filobacillus milosensis]